MSTDFKKVLVKDSRIGNLTDSIAYGVFKGGQQCTSAQFNAISASTSSHVYNIQVPSETTIIDRRVMWKSTVTLRIQGVPANGEQLINYGLTDALSAFPLHQLCTVISSTINNNTVSVNMRDVLPALLRMHDSKELASYNGTTPTMYDTYLSYSDAVGANNNPLSGYKTISDNDLCGRGTFSLDAVAADAGFTTAVANGDNAGAVRTAYVKFTVTEPLLLSPWIYGNPQTNNQGIYGIQNLNFQMNIGDASRVWRTAQADTVINSVQVVGFENSSLNFMFLTPHPSDLMSARCVVPFYELPRFQIQGGTMPAATAPAYVGASITPSKKDFTFNSISLNQIPDKLIIMVRKAMSTQTYQDSDSFLPITKFNLNWNNQSGICSNFTQYDLWRASKDCGSNQSWHEFKGIASTAFVGGAAAGTGAGTLIPTSGTVLMLQMGKDINITEDYYAPGSIGNFVLNFTVSCENYGAAIPTVELVLIAVNSGAFACERGTSSTYTALLTKNDVLETSQQEYITSSDVKRMVGSGFLDNLKSTFSTIGRIAQTLAPIAKPLLNLSGNKHAVQAANVLGSLGYGKTGGSDLTRRIKAKGYSPG